MSRRNPDAAHLRPGGAAQVAPERHRTVRFGAGPEWSVPQLLTTGVGTAGVALYLGSLYAAAGGFDGIWWLLLLLPGLTMSRAGSGVALAYWGLMLFGWVDLLPAGAYTWWSLPAAAGLLVSHAAVALSASTPPAGTFARASLVHWARAAAVAIAAAGAVALCAGALAGHGFTGSAVAWVVGLTGVAAGVWMLRSNPPADRD
jgi:hypothetical protein